MSENTKRSYPREWLERIPAHVFACLVPGELRVIVNGSASWDVPIEQIPEELRMPNTRLWLHLNEDFEILRGWRREDESISKQ